uniref:Nucleolar protein 6 n=1 Tax=Rhodnius prolixus TaxID=13249 RepID=T1HQ96_RHOPR
MIRLKETENLYQSNLFRLQIEEMISELKPRKTDKNAIKHWLQNFRQFLTQLEDCENILGKHHDHIDDVHLPLPKRIWQIEDSIKFYKPVDVKIMGSCRNGTVLGPYFVLDVVIIIPKKYFHKNDYLNQKYHYKRALYLSKIASLIQKSELVSPNFQIKYWLKRGDPLKPVLLFRPQGRMTEFVEVALNVYPEDNPYNLNRFLPEKNNVRPEWLGCERSHGQLPPTPHYNMSILEDLVAEQNEQLKLETFEGNQNLKDATILLSVWLQQRQLLKGFGAFNEDLLSMLVVYLVKKQKINNHMSSYQICRNVWLAFAQMDWTKQGISLSPKENQSLSCPLETFHKYFEIVFVDCTGVYNLCSQLNRTIYFRVREEAEKAIKYLNDPSINGFQILFMINMPFLQQYDHYICFTDPRTIDETLSQNMVVEKHMDFNGHKLPLFIKLLSDLLIEGLGNRLNYLSIQPVTLPQWKINEQCSENSITDVLIFGLKLNPEHALNVIEKGPEAYKDEAAKFREFWGDKCELRRFRDGTVCESVCWDTNDASLIDRRIVVKKIVNFLLKFKLKINKKQYNYVANQLQDLVVNQFVSAANPKEKNEEASQAVHKTFENISQQLRDMTDLPLSIVSVRCISPVYRFTDVFPPLPIMHSFNKKICMETNRGIVFQNKNISASPFYVEPIDLVLQMAMSQKWPNDLQAGKRLIAAFNIVIASSLKKKCGLNCQVTTDHIVVHKDGYVLRLYLGYSKEIALLKQQISAEGVTFYRDTPESILLEKKFINLPKVTGALYGLSQTHSSYGYATCLAKRWINSHLLDDFHFPTLVVELLMARLYVHPQPHEIAVQPLIAFLRFLNYIATTNWHIEPVIVNFNNLLSREQVTDIEKSFQANRSTLPPIVLATPYDLVGTLWTKDAPTLPTLIRLSKLAANSLKMLEIFLTTSPSIDNLMKVFEPSLSSYDAVIILKKSMLPRRLQCNFFKWSTGGKISELPISGFDPAKLYLQELRDHYNEYALFFHDTYGGNVIGVVLRPTFLEATDFKICNVGPRIPSHSEGKISLLPSKKSLIQGFYILGAGIV